MCVVSLVFVYSLLLSAVSLGLFSVFMVDYSVQGPKKYEATRSLVAEGP